MRALDRMNATEAEDAAMEENRPTRVFIKGREEAIRQGMQPSTHFPDRRALLALLSESERKILRKLGDPKSETGR